MDGNKASSNVKPVRLSAHAKGYCYSRGFNEDEVIETIYTSEWTEADRNRLECRKEFPFHNEWNKKYYDIKTVRPVFVEEETEIVVVTVYTYYR